MKKIVNAWLSPNMLTEDPNDYLARPIILGNLSLKDLVNELVKEGMEIKKETAIDIATRINRIAADKVLSGYSVNTGLVNMRLVVRGIFFDKTWDPNQHQLYIAINQGKELRDAVSETEVSILGIQAEPMEIFSITDISTGKRDGTITPGRNVDLKGTLIKIAGDSPDVGVTLRNIATDAVVKLSVEEIALNEPSRLILLIPITLSPGEYELKITSQYTGASPRKTPKSVVYEQPLIVS